MKKSKRRLTKSLAFNITGAIVILLVVFSVIISTIGYFSFTNAFKREYSDSTYHVAKTAAMLVNGNNIDSYLEQGKTPDYIDSAGYLDSYCQKMHVSIVYVIKVDTSDYNSFISIFNSVNNTVDNTKYSPWELGLVRETTNEEYRAKYKNIYENSSECETVFRTKDLNGVNPHITTMVPVKNTLGDVTALLCVQRPMNELKEGRKPYLITVAISTALLSLFVVIAAAYLLNRNLVHPIHRVIAEAHRFANENTQGEKFDNKISNIDEICDLAKSIETMEEDMIKYIDNLTVITAEKERVGAELSIAKIVQENSIPNVFPAYPEREDFDIFASMTPAKEVGGDFYNFFLIDDNHLAFVIGDVSGKGIPAALFMMVTNILVSSSIRRGGTPGEILTIVNNAICERNKANMFVTLFLGILELSTGKVIAANAGHDDAILYRKGGNFEQMKTKHGIVVGAVGGIKYNDFEFEMKSGDKIFIYTDGVPEATDKDNNMFNMERTVETLNQHKEEEPKEILEGVTNAVNEFVGEAPQFDDLTMLCIELKNNDSNCVKKELCIEATNDNLQQVIDFIDEILEENECSMKTQMKIDLSVEEIFVNIANYAYGKSTGFAEILAEVKNGEITIVFKDGGIRYNPLAKEDPDITLSAEDRAIGGLGIFLVKKNMDSVFYENKDGKNIFTITKKLD